MATNGQARVAAANAQALSGKVGGAVTSSGKLSSGGSVNAKDLPSYTPGTDPTDRQGSTNQVSAGVGPITQMTSDLTNSLSTDGTALTPPKTSGQPFSQPNAGNAFSGNNLSAYGITPEAVSKSAQYSKAKEALDASGVKTPDNAGAGSAMVSTALKSFTPTAEPQSAWNVPYELDPNIDKLFVEADDYYSPPKQKQSLLEEYKQMESALGISAINEELIDAKRIIEGTRDDVALEIEKAGGIATDSQVEALANARNKSLIKNYNYLLEMKQSATTQLSTMMQLSIQDRTFASAEFDKKIGFAFKVAEFRDRATNNSRDALNNVINQVGYRGLLASLGGNQIEIGLVEKTLGITRGGLSGLVANEQVGLGMGDTTQAIINNPSLFDDLTPTEKGKVISQLQQGGYDTSNLGLKGLSDTAIQNVSQTQKALDDLAILKTKIQGNTEKLGPITGLAAINPWSESRKLQADVDRVRQTVGKALEGGVLRKEDEEKYKKILATLTDTPSTAIYKIDALIGSVTRDIETYKSLQQSAGRSLNVSGKLQKAGETTRPEDLRKKYNY